MAELRPHVEELRAAGVLPYVIGSGTPAQAREFAAKLELGATLPVLSDAALATYRAAGFRRSASATLSPRGAIAYIKAFVHHPQTKQAGDPWQLGGAMIVRPDGEVTWRFASEHGGHHPALATLLDEARQATA